MYARDNNKERQAAAKGDPVAIAQQQARMQHQLSKRAGIPQASPDAWRLPDPINLLSNTWASQTDPVSGTPLSESQLAIENDELLRRFNILGSQEPQHQAQPQQETTEDQAQRVQNEAIASAAPKIVGEIGATNIKFSDAAFRMILIVAAICCRAMEYNMDVFQETIDGFCKENGVAVFKWPKLHKEAIDHLCDGSTNGPVTNNPSPRHSPCPSSDPNNVSLPDPLNGKSP